MKLPNTKDDKQILKSSREKNKVACKQRRIIVLDFSAAMQDVRKQCIKVFKFFRRNDFQIRILYPAKLSIIRHFHTCKNKTINLPCTLFRKLWTIPSGKWRHWPRKRKAWYLGVKGIEESTWKELKGKLSMRHMPKAQKEPVHTGVGNKGK